MIDLDSLVYPLFITDGKLIRKEVPSMPGIYRISIDVLKREINEIRKLGITSVLLFGVTKKKDKKASAAYAKGNIITSATAFLKSEFPKLKVVTDVCLCAYTLSGHCGILKENSREIDHNKTLETLSKMALSHAEAGADYVAPSAMAKKQVFNIRKTLDANGYVTTKIMGYSAKFSSQFYGPFRDAANSAPRFGNRRKYQLDYSDRQRALQEIDDDIKEGADIVMVKPALCYLDIIREAKNRFNHALAAYNVSGEYAMIKSGASSGYWDEKEIVYEVIASIKRAGAKIIITYHARDIAKWKKKGQL